MQSKKKVASSKPQPQISTVTNNVPVSNLNNAQQQQINSNSQPNSIFNISNPQNPTVFPVQQVQNNWSPPVQMSNANYAQFQQQAPQNFPPQMQMQMQMPVQINPSLHSNSNVAQIRNGMYGRRQLPNHQIKMPDIFNDDEAIIERVKQQKKDVKIEIEIQAQRSMAKLKQEVMLPAMCSIKTQGGSRTSIDLICVIDVSGSMNGQKIQLVKSTMKYLLQALTSSDRLSIITFESWGQRLCGLKCVTPQNMVALNQHINSLSARGGTNICSGLNLAVKTIKQRKHTNKITSVFLLSDGQDKGAEATFKQTLKQQGQNLGVFSIHSFGFGTDHDQDLMTKICQMKEGSFYFIKELATLDEAFSNALGGVISMVATDVVIKLSNISKNIVQGVKIKKVYGQMWQKLTQKEYRIKILQLMSGVSKDYVFEIQIPKINTQVGDLDRDHDILEAIYTAKALDNSNLSGECSFKITLLNENQQIPEVNENIDVIENHLRVVASQAIEQNMKKAQQNKFEEAQKGIDNMIGYIQGNKKARKQKLQHLVNDLQNIKQKCSNQNEYQQQGKKWMKSAQIAHSQQNNYAYSNCVQQTMVNNQKAKKSKY